MSLHNLDSVARARAKIAAAVARAEQRAAVAPVIARANSKTDAINEGSAPLVTCCAHACATCGRECYAVWHMAHLYPAVLDRVATNTVARRRDPVAYYRAFFSAAIEHGKRLVRANETGDFDDAAQLRALYRVARDPLAVACGVVVIGYTRRRELIPYLDQAPANVHIRYSLYRDGDAGGDTVRQARCACVSSSETTCPAQTRADINRRRKAAGLDPLPDWTCALCAAHGIGCASSRAVVIFRAH